MLNKLKKALSVSVTENGASTYNTSGQAVLDYFAQGSSLRNRDDESIIDLFKKSFKEDKLLTLKVLFNSRDCREGQGERKTFRTILKYLGSIDSIEMKRNMLLIPFYGRWDDLYAFIDTPLWECALCVIKTQLDIDLKCDTPSLLGKWLKSENTSSKESRYLAYITRTDLRMSSKEYRKMLTKLRKKIKIVENNLRIKDYKNIEYSNLPSQASIKYVKAFYRNDFEGYSEYLESLIKGESKVNVGTLSPDQLVNKVLSVYNEYDTDTTIYNEMWKAIPDYLNGSKENCLAVIDTSGSMCGKPLEIAIALGLYVAEKNEGHFKDHFITFSSSPRLIEIEGDTFTDRVRNIENANWGMNTNVEKIFDLILKTAIDNNLKQEELPTRLFIISDMEFDSISSYDYVWPNTWNNTLFQSLTKRFNKFGYKMPKLVFWNVDSRNNNIPMREEDNVQLVSGSNPRLFESLVKGEFLSAIELMLEVLNNKRYDLITL